MALAQTPRAKARKDSRRQHLFCSAEALVREGGFAALTMQALAERAQVSVGTLYRYFKNKDELSVAVFTQATERELQALSASAQQPGTVRQRLQHMVVLFAERAQIAPVLARALIAEPVDPEVDRARLSYRQRYADIFTKLLHEGMASQELPQQSPALTATAIVGAIAEAVAGPLSAPLAEERLPQQLALLVLRACGAVQ